MTMWSTDPVFRRFAALVADGMLFARLHGQTVAAGGMCPLGAVMYAHGHGHTKRPWSGSFTGMVLRHHLGMFNFSELKPLATNFINGFDGASDPEDTISAVDLNAFRLGQGYRLRRRSAAESL